MAKFKTIITTAGAAKIAAVLAGTASIVLDNTAKMAVGDGGGTLPTPNPAQTKLVNEVHRAPINRASIDTSDPKNIVAELVIPPGTGGFWLREMALYDAAGTLLAVGNMAETYKPSLSEGAGRKMVIRMVIAVSEVNAITITMDTTTVMATQDYVDNEIDKHAKSRNHPDATLTAKGFTQLNSATNSASETQAATPKAVKTVMDATNLKAPLASPSLTGMPTAPTPAQTVNNTQLATTAYVKTAVAAIINSSPEALDTLGELAAALGNDANFAATVTNQLALKAPLANPALTGKPTAPTAPKSSNDTQLATTEFVTRAVEPALLMRGGLPATANLNSYGPTPDFIGIWSRSTSTNTTAAYNFPEDGGWGQGILEVIAGGLQGGMQRYTTGSGNVYTRNLTAAWNGTDGPWGAWIFVGANPMAGDFGGDLNTLTSPGMWSTTAAVTNSPIPAGQTVSLAICNVSKRSSGTAVMQTYTPIATNAALINRTWQRTLSGTTWSPWELLGTKALNDLGMGLGALPVTSGTLDWQQAGFTIGSVKNMQYQQWVNGPVLPNVAAATNCYIYVLYANSVSNYFHLLVSASRGAALLDFYSIIVSGNKGTRTITVRQIFTSADTIPLTSGGLGATTPEGGRKTLGFENMGIGLPSMVNTGTFDWQQFDFLSGAIHLTLNAYWTNAPAQINYVAGTQVCIHVVGVSGDGTTFELQLFPMATSNSNYRVYNVRISGAKGARAFTVRQLFSSAESIPIVNGGTGATSAPAARDNLGLSAGLPPIGIPFFWPSAAMPNTVMPEWADMVFLKWNDATFSATTYPKLALVIPSLKLTEARGEFPRIWDDGRGVDAGRTLLSVQSDAFKAHGHDFESWPDSGNPASKGGAVDAHGGDGNKFIKSGVVKETGGTETRPRNIAFNFLVRAK